LERRDAALARAGQLLAALSYQGVLARGFALVRDAGGRPLRAALSVTPGMALDIEFSDGRVPAMVTGATAMRPQPTAARGKFRKRRGGEGQGTLFD
jgi:exodeoxyribonuclease VII large subunit